MPPDLAAITTILHDVFEREPADWSRRLEELCAAHPEHATELRRRYDLLRATGLDQDVTFDEPPPPPGLPERLGEFRLLDRLGSGGMGMVFAAEQTSLGRQVALKVVRPEFLFADAARERFRREIDAIARLEHPAIVPVLTHGEEGGVPFYAMPLVHGCPADEVVRRLEGRDPRALTGADLQRAIGGADDAATAAPADGAAPRTDTATATADGTFAGSWWEACVRLMRQVALGLQHAHSRGIVHRDVKPSNVMLTPDGRALLFDFGLAHVRDDARITRTGTAPGSPAYMSPEQMLGRASDERTDVYSLAATLRHLVSLRCPFPIQDSEVLRARILAGQPEPLHDDGVPPELRVVLAAAMDVDREQRHPGAAAFADDLQAVLERRPIRARPLPLALRVRRWCGRHRAATVAVAAVLVLGAVLPTALWQQQRSANAALRERTERLREQTERAERNFARSLLVIDEMLLRAGDERLRNVPGAQAVAADLMQRAVDYFDHAAAQEADVSLFRPRHISAIQHLATTRMDLGDPAAAEALAERSVRMVTEDGGDLPTDRVRRAYARFVLASARERVGKLRDALAELDAIDRELQDVPTATEGVQSVRGRALTLRGGICERTGDAAGARVAFAAALTIFRDGVANETMAPSEAAAAAYNLARILRRAGETAATHALLDEAMARLEGQPDDEGVWPTPAMVRALVHAERARLLDVANDLDGSARAYRAAIAEGERLVDVYPKLPSLRRDLGGSRCNLGNLLGRQGDLARGAELQRAAIADLERSLRDAPGDEQAEAFLCNARKSLCFLLREAGAFDELADAARGYGRLPGDAAITIGAARHLLRCAENTTGAAAAALRDEALELLLESERRGWNQARLDDPLYAPLQTDARFASLRARVEAKAR